jgi:hypothetical protein
LNVTIGNYLLTDDVNETIVNGARTKIPIRLMRTYDDALRITTARARNSTKALSDSLTITGEIAVEAIDSTNLAAEELTLTWGEQSFVIPAGSMVQPNATKKAYRCSNLTLAEGGKATGQFDLDKCTFNIIVSKANLDVTSGAVTFGISFAEFDESAELNLP